MTGGRSLFANLAWSIGIGMLVIHLIGTGWYGHERMLARAETFALSSIDRALTYRELDSATRHALDGFSSDEFRTRLTDAPATPIGETWRHNSEVQSAVDEALATRSKLIGGRVTVVYYHVGRQAWLSLSVPVRDGRWLLVNARTDATRFGAIGALTTTVTFLVIALVLVATRRTTSYLASFAAATEAIGLGDTYEPLPENRGPHEVRRASQAFNAMQSRVQSLINQRTQMLAAVSHDLRTIATRLQLRVEEIPDAVSRQKAEQDLAAMAVILDESLAFARDASAEEPRTLLDLGSLLQAVVDDVTDVGGKTSLLIESKVRIDGQAVALRRAFANLVDNAVRYGDEAHVLLKSGGVVEIHDKGPGISTEDVTRALEPFVRLEASRNRGTGGTGLGLTIARNVILRHGGTLFFSRLPQGFVVHVVLPVAD